jgi:hypothetical protein
MAKYLEQSSASAGGVRESAADARERRYAAARQGRVATRSRVLSELMEKRSDLVGVYGPADLTVELLRWSA